MTVLSVTASQVRTALLLREEIALLDVRHEATFATGHPLFAANMAAGRIVLEAEARLPRKDVAIVLYDNGEGLVPVAAEQLKALGYGNVRQLEGGLQGWKAAGYEVFEDVNSYAKAFGELVEARRHTPSLAAEEVNALIADGANIQILDVRRFDEYATMNIPGSISVPGAELVLRAGRAAPDPETTIIVNCAGRTRSIIGAQTLIDFGVKNDVVALENGTQAWWLEGLAVERGADRQAPGPAADAALLAEKRRQARTHADRHGVKFVSTAEVVAFIADAGRTTYLFDTREAAEYEAGHLPRFIHAPGGQLVQATDQWVGMRNARIVLAGAEMVRAPVTAAWLRQLGHDAYVLVEDAGSAGALQAARPAPAPSFDAAAIAVREVSPQDVSALLWSGGGTALDLRASADYRKGHIPGSVWSIRPRVVSAVKDKSAPVLLIADDPGLARLAARDLREAGASDVAVLRGGIAAWQADGQSLNASPDLPPDRERIDFIFHTLGRNEGNLDAARAYLAWEIALTDQLDAQERGSFRV
jgi:rhodanese-related sulfurtransferase